MSLRGALVALIVCAAAAVVQAAPELDADRAFEAAVKRSAAGDPGAIEAFQAIADGPVTRWSDDAWSEIARLAERAGDYARARRGHEQVIAANADQVLVRRSRAALRRLATGTGGAWDPVRREHERLANAVFAGGDPRAALEELEQLARGHPGYPQVTNVWLVVARGWEMEGDGARGLALLRDRIAALDAPAAREHVDPVAARAARIARHRDRERVGLAFARLAIRRGELEAAGGELDRLIARSGADRVAIEHVRSQLSTTEHRRTIRTVLWIAIAMIAITMIALLRRDAGSWRTAVRRLVPPPSEAVFLLPVGAVLVTVAQTGNPVVARALLWIAIAGVVVAWLSGAGLEVHRTRVGRLGVKRVTLQIVLAIGAVAATSYLAIDRDRLLDLIEETIEHGPATR